MKPPGQVVSAHLRGVLRREQQRRVEEHAAAFGLSLTAATQSLAAADLARPSLTAPALPDEARRASADPARCLDDLVLVNPLGGGGAGEVWRAWDARLGRWVAVKLPRAVGDLQAGQDRFNREALAIARLDHPNILPLHRLGQTATGRPYLVMPLVQGCTLDQIDLPPMRVVEVMRAAALGIAHAHERGVTHRDLKPSNIMLADDGRVFVLDFGLVYLQEQADDVMTAPGNVVGTGAYLSPEQAIGSEGSRRPAADVYGLGATLFHLLTGRPPFQGATLAEVVRKVVDEQPPRLRALVPSLPVGLERVVNQCLQKAPEKRYPSATSLAEDLGRVLEEQPVRARAVRRRSNWRRTLAGLAVLVGAGAVAAMVHQGSRQRGETLKTAQAMVRVSLDSALRLRRAGDVAGMRNVLPDLLAAYDLAQKQGIRSAELESLVGRVHRVLADEPRALAYQERALAERPTFAPALYERALLQARVYGREVERARALSPGGAGPFGIHRPGAHTHPRVGTPHLEALRQMIVRDLSALASVSVPPGIRALTSGLLAYHEGAPTRALPLLERATSLDPDNGDAWEALARVAFALGDRTRAEEACTAGLRVDAANVALLTGRCQLRADQGGLDAAEEDATRALALVPALPEAFLCRGTVRGQKAHAAVLRGGDAGALLASAEADLQRAAAAAPQAPATLMAQGLLSRYQALAQFRNGADPRPALSRADGVLSNAIALAPHESFLHTQRGRGRWQQAVYLERTGRSPMALLDASLRDLSEAIRLEPKRVEAHAWRADVHAVRARWLRDQGDDATAAFAAAEADFAVATQHPQPWARVHRAAMRIEKARFEAGRHRPSERTRAGAEADLTYATQQLPDQADPFMLRARLVLDQGCAGQRAADRDVTRALSLNPRHAEAWIERGRLLRCRADHVSARAAFDQARGIDGHLRID